MTSPQDRDALTRELRQCRHLSQIRAGDLDRACAELAATRARATAFANQLEQALQRVAALSDSVARLQAEQARLTALVHARGETGDTTESDLQAEIARLLQHRDEARMLRQSLSWRVTRPLRALRHPRRTLRILLDRLSGGEGG
jgi:chromosome segregation ATPase